MVEFQIDWTVEARLDLIDILDFYIERNGNAYYSKKLNSKIQKSISLISKNPIIGTQSDQDSVRILTTGDYQLIYKIVNKIILVVMIWDCRRNPDDKLIGKRI